MSLNTTTPAPAANYPAHHDDGFLGFDEVEAREGLALLWGSGGGTLVCVDDDDATTDHACPSVADGVVALQRFEECAADVGMTFRGADGRVSAIVTELPAKRVLADVVLTHPTNGKRYIHFLDEPRAPLPGEGFAAPCPGYNGWRDAGIMEKEVSYSVGEGENTGRGKWKERRKTRRAFQHYLLKHKEGDKEGSCFTGGLCIEGHRSKKSIASMSMLVVDLDSGQPIEEIRAKIEAKGLHCVVYTTHSHMKPVSEIDRDEYNKWVSANDGAGLREYLISERGFIDSVASAATAGAHSHTARGAKIIVAHPPIQKCRLVFFLKRPFVFLRNDMSLKDTTELWKRLYVAVCEQLGLFYDKKCTDPSRLFYDPRHPEGSTDFDSFVIDGNELNLDDYEPAKYVKGLDRGQRDPYLAAGDKTQYEFGNTNLNVWIATGGGESFEILAAITEGDADNVLDDKGHIRCPFEHEHSNNEEDRATFVKNATEAESGFVVYCQHTACDGRDRLQFMQAFLDQGYFEESALYADHLVALHDDAPRPKATADDIDAAITNLATGDDLTEVAAMVATAGLNVVDLKRVSNRIAEKTGDDKRAVHSLVSREAKKATKAGRKAPAEVGGKPVISTGADFDDQLEAAAKALQAHAEKGQHLYKVNGAIARVARSEGMATYIQTLDKGDVWFELNKAATFTRLIGEEVRGVEAPTAVSDMIHRDPSPGYRPLKGVVRTPVFAADGSLITSPGYHAPSALYYDPPEGFEVPVVPDSPSADEVGAAKALIREHLYRDFPFYGDHDNGAASEAHAFCLILQEFAREMIAGATPIYLLDKPMAGTGAGKFMNATAIVWTGHGAKAQTEAGTEDERRKNITASLLDGGSYYFLDNINKPVDSSAYASATASDTWVDRPLGQSRKVEVPIRCTWIFCGNNPQLSGELARRCVRIRLDAKSSDPTTGRAFLYPDLEGWAKEHRGKLVGACLTLVRAWIAAGCPSGTTGRLGSYEKWSDVMGGILNVANIPGFLGNVSELRAEMDSERGLVQAFVERWFDIHGTEVVTVGDGLLDVATEDGDTCSAFPELPFTNGHDGRVKTQALGYFLRGIKYHPFNVGDKQVQVTPGKLKNGSNSYWLRVVG